ncbi:MAG: ABC transporter permease [Chloroflexi bacterium]|uniref:ABC transporter permease n=1 Tax=Candidatus Chlorohelix allophototropha TaxID=3003348 RepID=A0A8T7M595_9CHLR|nr:ABC transporter permease [Chloroflexota bacterium]WJW69117.1 ABC transporter permease [Chloroflexota bacterium L227-S17]
MKKQRFWPIMMILLGAIYFLLPLFATFEFSLRERRGVYSFDSYNNVLGDPQFRDSFIYSVVLGLATIAVSLILIVPTAFWVHLKLPQLRPVMEFITLLPFVVPPIVLVFGLIRIYSRPPFVLVSTPALLVAGYVVLSFPYMYRAVDTGLRAIDVRSLTEAAQSLGAGWLTILFRIIFPNLRVSLLNGAFLTFAIVLGEFTMATMLNWPTFGPYLALIGQNRAYEPAALAIISFGLTWICIGLIQLLSRGSQEQGQLAGTR